MGITEKCVALNELETAQGVEADCIVFGSFVKLDHDCHSFGIRQGNGIDFLWRDESTIIRYYPHFMLVDADTIRVFESGIDEIDEHPPLVIGFDDLS